MGLGLGLDSGVWVGGGWGEGSRLHGVCTHPRTALRQRVSGRVRVRVRVRARVRVRVRARVRA